MRGTTPQWLYGALDEALVNAGSSAPESARRDFVQRLISAWNLEGRYVHNCRYLAQVFERLDELEGATSEPENLKLAAALRGALEEPGWEEAEELRGPTTFPAMVSLQDLSDMGIDDEVVSRISSLVEQLASHAPADKDLGARLLVDADMAALASSPQEYRDFLANLRQEAMHMPERDFLRIRRGILAHLLGRAHIFSTPLASQWEDSARNNLEAELETIEAKIARLDLARSDGGAGVNETPGSKDDLSGVPTSHRKVTEVDEGGELENLIDVLEKGGPTRQHSRVLRISRSQKASRIKTPVEPAQEESAERSIYTEQGTRGTAPESAEGESSSTADTSRLVSDTSTLESVADLMEGQKRKPPKSRM